MKKVITIIILSLFVNLGYSQLIKIGQKSESVLATIQYYVSNHNQPDSYGRYPNDIVKYSTIYDNGVLTTVILERYGTLLIPLNKVVDYSVYYEMNHGYLQSITTVYPTLSKTQVSNLKENTSYKLQTDFGEYYLSMDLKGCESVYMNASNHPCVKYFEKELYPTWLSEVVLKKKKNVIEELEKEEAEREANKYVDIANSDPTIKDKIIIECMEYLKRFFNRDQRCSHLKSICEVLDNVSKTNVGYQIDSSTIQLRIEQGDSQYYGPKTNIKYLHGSDLMKKVIKSGCSISHIPTAGYQKINYVEFDSLDINSILGGFSFLIKKKKGERKVIVLNNTPLPKTSSNWDSKNPSNFYSLEEFLFQYILSDANITDKKEYSIEYCFFNIGNRKDFSIFIKENL